MDERWTTDAKLEALEAMRDDAMTTKTRARAAAKELAGRLARGGETSEEARAKTVEVVACALRAGVGDEEGDGDGGVEEDARGGVREALVRGLWMCSRDACARVAAARWTRRRRRRRGEIWGWMARAWWKKSWRRR